MEIASYITVNLLLFSSWYILLYRYRAGLSFADRVLGTFILGLGQIILTQMVLGVVFKELFAVPLFLFNVALSFAVMIVAFVRKPGPLLSMFSEVNEKTGWFFRTIKNDWMLFGVFSLFFVSLCFMLYTGYLFPSYSWDALFYHLPTIGFILQSGTIENIPYNSLIYTFINVFPKNIDLFFLWNVIFLKSTAIVDLSQLPFTIAGMLAVYSLAVKLGIEQKQAVFCSLLFFFTPVVILQSTANYVDIAISTLFLIALNFTLRPSGPLFPGSNGDARISLLLAGLTTGILLGSKGSGPLFVTALTIMYLGFELRTHCYLRQKGHFLTFKKIVINYPVFFIIPFILFGSYWYIQNWMYYGNPVYPFQISLFGKVLFPGTITQILHSGPRFLQEMHPLFKPFYVWLEKVEHYYYASELSGAGPLWFILFLPAGVISLIYAVWKRKYDFLLTALIMIFVFLVHPNNWNTRYAIFIFAFGALSFGLLCELFEKRVKVLKFLSTLLAVYVFLTAQSPSVTPAKIKEFVQLPADERTVAKMDEFILNKSQTGNYGLWEWINRNVKAGETLAYNFHPNMLGPLWNNNLTNKIIYVKSGEFNGWLEKLEQHGVDYVLVLARPRSMEHFWLEKLSALRHDPKWAAVYNRFRLEYSDDNYFVARFQ